MMVSARFGANLLVAAYLAIIAAAWVAIDLGSEQFGWTALLREVSHLLFVPLPLLLVLALITRGRIALLGLAVPLLAFAYCHGPRLTPGEAADAPMPGFRVLTFNLGASRGLGRAEDTLQAIDRSGADVVCLIEAPGNTLAAVGARVHGTYPYQISSDDIFVLSRFPLTETRTRVVSIGAKDSLRATLEVDHRLTTLTVVQLQRVDAYRGLRSGPGRLVSAVRSFATDARDAAVTEVLELIRAEGGSQLLVGDLNMTPTSRAYQHLKTELRDAFVEAGRGLGHTYPTTLRTMGSDLTLPLLRIDYILHSPDLVATRAWVGQSSGSDHLPLTAEFGFR